MDALYPAHEPRASLLAQYSAELRPVFYRWRGPFLSRFGQLLQDHAYPAPSSPSLSLERPASLQALLVWRKLEPIPFPSPFQVQRGALTSPSHYEPGRLVSVSLRA